MRAPRPHSRGMALPTVLLVMLVLTLLGTAAAFTASTDLDITRNRREDLEGLSIAEAGIHEAIARLNQKAAGGLKLTPPDPPVVNWETIIVNSGAPGANETQTMTGAFGSATALPIWTRVTYKLESGGELPTPHCNGGCNDGAEVVRYHTDYQYGGTRVPGGTRVGPPVLQLESRFTRNGAVTKTVLVELVRSVTYAKIPGTVRTCGPVDVSGFNQTDGTNHPDQVPIYASGAYSKAGAPNITPEVNVQQNQPACTPQLFEETFGMTKEEMKGLADVVAVAPAPVPADGTRGKIIYVTGAAQSNWDNNPVIGSEAEPVIVIFEGDFRIEGTVTIYGVVYVMGQFSIGAGTPNIYGSVVSEGPGATTLTGNSTFRYNPNVMNNLGRLTPYTALLWRVN